MTTVARTTTNKLHNNVLCVQELQTFAFAFDVWNVSVDWQGTAYNNVSRSQYEVS